MRLTDDEKKFITANDNRCEQRVTLFKKPRNGKKPFAIVDHVTNGHVEFPIPAIQSLLNRGWLRRGSISSDILETYWLTSKAYEELNPIPAPTKEDGKTKEAGSE